MGSKVYPYPGGRAVGLIVLTVLAHLGGLPSRDAYPYAWPVSAAGYLRGDGQAADVWSLRTAPDDEPALSTKRPLRILAWMAGGLSDVAFVALLWALASGQEVPQ